MAGARGAGVPHLAGASQVDPPSGLSYPLVLRIPGHPWWRSALGVLIGLLLYILLGQVITQVVVGIGFATSRPDATWTDYYASALRFELPVGLLATNLAITALVPLSILLVAWLHGVRPRWLFSVQPGVRWRYLLISLFIAAIGLAAGLALSTAAEGSTVAEGGSLTFHPQQGFWWFLPVILITSPIQAVGEEVFFRGYLTQALGSMVANRWFGVVVSAAVFTAFHGSSNPKLIADRLAFGLLAAILVTLTGGLEAGIAAHIMNNVMAFTLAGLTTSISQVATVTSITWAQAGFDILGFLIVAALTWLLARKMKLATRT